jgi:magnesium-transporting ATPase (P-type)
LRTFAFAYKDLEPNQNGEKHDEPVHDPIKDIEKDGFTFLALYGVEFPLKPQVKEAVDQMSY